MRLVILYSWDEMNTFLDTNLGEVFANRAIVKLTLDTFQEQLVELFTK